MGERMGKVIEFLGQWTNDRKVEAKGRVEQKAADESQPVDETSDAAIAEEQEAVRREHGDVSDGAPRNR